MTSSEDEVLQFHTHNLARQRPTLATYHSEVRHPIVALLTTDDARPEILAALQRASVTVSNSEFDAIVVARNTTDWLPIGSKVPVVAVVADQLQLRQAVAAGLAGIVHEEAVERALGATVLAVCAGQAAVPAAVWDARTRPQLSSREKQVLSLVVMGFSNAEIANQLWVAQSTVKSHLSSAFTKLGVRSRTEATTLILDPHAGLGTGILMLTGDDERVGSR